MKLTSSISVLALVIAAAPLVAQGPGGAPCPAAPTPASRDSASGQSANRVASTTGDADVVIFAAASAREVRFAKQPELSIRLCGGLDSIHVLERRNLPSPVLAGTTYRDVYVAVQIFGRLNADCITRALTGRSSRDSSTSATNSPGAACASLEIQGASRNPPSVKPPAGSGRTPRI